MVDSLGDGRVTWHGWTLFLFSPPSFRGPRRRRGGEAVVDPPEGVVVILVSWPAAYDTWLRLDGIVSGVESHGGGERFPSCSAEACCAELVARAWTFIPGL